MENQEKKFPDLPFLEMSDDLCKKFEIDPKYLILIMKEPTDWEFITKMGALYEAGATQILVQGVGREELRRNFSVLPLCGSQNSKESFIRSLGLLTSISLKRMKVFAEIRNQTVHNTRNFKIQLAEYITKLKEDNPNKLQEVQKIFYFDFQNKTSKSYEDKLWKKYDQDLGLRVRLGMTMAMSMFMMEVYLNKEAFNYLELEKKLKEDLSLCRISTP